MCENVEMKKPIQEIMQYDCFFNHPQYLSIIFDSSVNLIININTAL